MQFEFKILDYLQTIHTPMLDRIMVGISVSGNNGIIYIAFILFFLFFPKTRKLGNYLIVCLILESVVCNIFVKPIIARPRPYWLNPDAVLLIKALKDFSYPSGHTAPAFTFAAAAYRGKRNGISMFFVGFGLLMAFSRMYLYMHFPTDILGGMIIGAGCGWIGYEIAVKIEKRIRKKKQTA